MGSLHSSQIALSVGWEIFDSGVQNCTQRDLVRFRVDTQRESNIPHSIGEGTGESTMR